MKRLIRFLPFAGALFFALPASAAQGNVNAIHLFDLNHNGRIERAVITVDNPFLRTWKVSDASAIRGWYGTTQLTVTQVFVTTTKLDELAKIEVVWDESALPIDTSAAGFELEYGATTIGSGFDDGTDGLSLIMKGDTNAGDTEIDHAAPLLASTSPAVGSIGLARDQALTLTFSEPITPTSLVYLSEPDAVGWTPAWSEGNTVVTLNHNKYSAGSQVTFTVTQATDAAGNGIIPGAVYLNPFFFANTSGTAANPTVQPVFKLNEPRAGTSLLAGTPTVISWYSNQPEISSVRLSYTADGGSTYTAIATVPVTQGFHYWYPPNLSSSIQLKIEGLTSSSAIFNFDAHSPITIARPSPLPKIVTIVPGAASGVTDTAAMLSAGFDGKPQIIELYCGGAKRAEAVSLSGDRPVMAQTLLTGLTTGAAYDCHFRVTDIFGTVTQAAVPQFQASSQGDTKPPALLGAPKFDTFSWDAKTARMTILTDEAVSLIVDYGPTPYLDRHAVATDFTTTHAITLDMLVPGGAHTVQLSMTDKAGNVTKSKVYSFTFLKNGDRIKGTSAAVYWYLDGKRFVFPNETIYRSWFADFLNVIPISDDQLSTTDIGGNVQIHTGTWMVKIQSDPKTYAVDPGGILRHVQSEAQAKALFGADWNTRVRDIDVAFFGDYRIGEPLKDGEFPDAYAARGADGRRWAIMADIHRHELPKAGLESNHYYGAVYDPNFLPLADETTVAWTRLVLKDPITVYDPRLNVVRLTPGGAKIYGP